MTHIATAPYSTGILTRFRAFFLFTLLTLSLFTVVTVPAASAQTDPSAPATGLGPQGQTAAQPENTVKYLVSYTVNVLAYLVSPAVILYGFVAMFIMQKRGALMYIIGGVILFLGSGLAAWLQSAASKT